MMFLLYIFYLFKFYLQPIQKGNALYCTWSLFLECKIFARELLMQNFCPRLLNAKFLRGMNFYSFIHAWYSSKKFVISAFNEKSSLEFLYWDKLWHHYILMLKEFLKRYIFNSKYRSIKSFGFFSTIHMQLITSLHNILWMNNYIIFNWELVLIISLQSAVSSYLFKLFTRDSQNNIIEINNV